MRRFKLPKRVSVVFRLLRRRKSPNPYRRLCSRRCAAVSAICGWGSRLKKAAKSLTWIGPGARKYSPLDEPTEPVPKGYLAVYVGDCEVRRVLVPVVYFNHPLFADLLREAEEEYGFHHAGGITIPCGISDFERVKTTIASRRKSLLCFWQ